MSLRVVARMPVQFVILSHCLLCFGPHAVAQPASNPSAVSVRSLRVYAESVSTLKALDFKNRSYNLDGTEVQVKSGVFHYREGANWEDVEVGDVWFLTEPRDGSQYAVVSLSHDYGGTGEFDGFVQVFTVANKRLELVQELSFDEKANGSGVKFDANSRRLTIRSRTTDGSPECCAKNLDVSDFVWNGGGFTFTKVVRIPVKPYNAR
jgi:hypothetical protein